MTRKDYVAIARAIRDIRATLIVAHTNVNNRDVALSAVDSTALRLASVLQEDNERFDRDRFLLAAKFGGEAPPLVIRPEDNHAGQGAR